MKPMLAASTDGIGLKYPLLASPKLDGVRALILKGRVLSRALKEIPNKYVQEIFGKEEYNGLDGELVVGDPTASNSFHASSEVLCRSKKPKVAFHVFDDSSNPKLEFESRLRNIAERTCDNALMLPVYHTKVSSHKMLMSVEAEFLESGFEGVMLRVPSGIYKYGRSTLNEAFLMKLKRFKDSEAEVIGFKEQMQNTNEVKLNGLGYKVRPHKKSGMVAKGVLGALIVRDIKTKITFDIEVGFTALQRKIFWGGRNNMLGTLVKYKYQPAGVKEKPGFPVFLGFRNKVDL